MAALLGEGAERFRRHADRAQLLAAIEEDRHPAVLAGALNREFIAAVIARARTVPAPPQQGAPDTNAA